MSNRVSRLLHADWPEYLSYDKAVSGLEEFYSMVHGTITEKSSIFYHKRQAEIFLLALAMGIDMGERKKLAKPSQTIRCNTLLEKEVWMMCSVALAEERTLDVLANPSKMIRICEEYANGGIKTLMSLNMRSGSSISEPYEENLEGLLDKYLPRDQ